MKVSFFVRGVPVPKARPRVTRSGHTYTPARTAAWEEQIAWAATAAMKGRAPIDGPVFAEFSFAGARSNADLSNLQKAVEDACNGILYFDDKQIEDIHVRRINGEPGVLVEAWDADHQDPVGPVS